MTSVLRPGIASYEGIQEGIGLRPPILHTRLDKPHDLPAGRNVGEAIEGIEEVVSLTSLR